MATKNSVMVANAVANPIVMSHRKSGEVKVSLDQVALLAADVDNADDNILMCLIPSNAVIMDIQILNDDLDTHGTPTLAANVGLAYTGIGSGQIEGEKVLGDLVDADCFASADISLQSAHVVWTSVRYEAADIISARKEAWEVGGLSADPGGLFAIVIDLTVAAATGAAGDIVMRVSYV
jgi:hypothetical protein